MQTTIYVLVRQEIYANLSEKQNINRKQQKYTQ